jgi:hypothetical protein
LNEYIPTDNESIRGARSENRPREKIGISGITEPINQWTSPKTKNIFKPLVIDRHKLFRSDTGIRKVARAILKTINAAYFKFLFTFFCVPCPRDMPLQSVELSSWTVARLFRFLMPLLHPALVMLL